MKAEPGNGRKGVIGANAIAGGSLGLLLGVLIGMSATPVVANVIGALTTAGLAFVGLRSGGKHTGNGEAGSAGAPATGIIPRLSGFAILCLAGVFLGLFVRTHDVLGLSISDQIKKWTDAKYSDDDARRIVVFEQTGLTMGDWKSGSRPSPGPDDSLLYGAAGELWSETDPTKFRSPADAIQAWTNYGGIWAPAATMIQKDVPVEKQMDALIQIHEILKPKS